MKAFLKKYKFKAVLAGAVILLHPVVMAQNIKVAIAANLQPVMKVLQKDFKYKTGTSVDIISGPSGNLAAQIRNGAPFDLFLSADTAFPEKLYEDGLTITKPVVYATGVLIVCGTQKINFTLWSKLLTAPGIQKIAIGNPAIAPYGKAAREALKKAGIYETVKNKIVLGENLTQVNTYITTGVVQAGFTTMALVNDPANKTPLYWKSIDQHMYTPITQGVVLLKHAKNNIAASKFYNYILSPAARAIFKSFGYHVQ